MRIWSITNLFLVHTYLSILTVNAQNNDDKASLRTKLLTLSPNATWNQEAAVQLQFNAYHTQGLVKIGDSFFMTAVEVERWPKEYKTPQGKYDRDTGIGKGHLFKFDATGKLLKDLPIGEGDAYHPGGIDYDGQFIWIPVTEYRPNSFSIIYRLDPKTLQLTEVLRCPESIGAIVHNTDANTLVGANWGARTFYTWQLNTKGNLKNKTIPLTKIATDNPSFYVDFQDCKYLGNNLMLGSGHQTYQMGKELFRLGGWELIDLTDFRLRRQIPIKLWSPSGSSMLNNPCTIESTSRGLMAYFVPDDDHNATLFIYSITQPSFQTKTPN